MTRSAITGFQANKGHQVDAISTKTQQRRRNKFADNRVNATTVVIYMIIQNDWLVYNRRKISTALDRAIRDHDFD